MDRDTHQELNDEQKTRLFQLGLEENATGPEIDPDEERCDYLYQILRRPLPVPRATATTLPGPLQGLSRELTVIAGKNLGDILHDHNTSLSTLNQIKDYAKRMGQHAHQDVVQDVYMVIYFAAIAAALIRHQTKISQHNDTDLFRFFRQYQDQNWIAIELKNLFAKTKG